jgi:hypothetical protein
MSCFINFRSLRDLGSNYVVAETNGGYFSNAVLNFDTDTAGRTVANLTLHDPQKNFRGQIWGHNDPALLARVVEQICGTKQVSNRLLVLT